MGSFFPKKAPHTQGPNPVPIDPIDALFKALYREHVRLLGNFLRSFGIREPEALEDLVQDVFATAYRKWKTFDPSVGSERAWLLGIAAQEARNYRRRVREDRMDKDDDPPLGSAGDLEGRFSDMERVQILLKSTTPERRQVFELYELEEFTIPEIARILAIHEEAAAKRLRLAREDIQAAAKRLRAREKHEAESRGLYFLPLLDRDLWRAMRDAQCPINEEAEARIWKNIRAELGLPPSPLPRASVPPPRPVSSPPSPARPSFASRMLARAASHPLLGYIGTAFVSGAIGVAITHATTPTIRILPMPYPVPLAMSAAAREALAAPEASSSSVDPLPALPASAAPPPTNELRGGEAEELRLLRKAQAAYASGDKKKALAAMDEYERIFKNGRFRARWSRLRELMTLSEEP